MRFPALITIPINFCINLNRKRYLRGGTATDDELTAAQLRARHGIASNPKGRESYIEL